MNDKDQLPLILDDRKSPPIYGQLKIRLDINEEAFELGAIRNLVIAHLGKVRSGSITDAGRDILLEIYQELDSVELLLKGQ
jgi:hypothetical protein